VLVVLNKSSSLFKVFAIEMILESLYELLNDWDPIFTNDNSFHLNTSYLSIPVVGSNVWNGYSFLRLGIEDLLHEIFEGL